MKVYKDVVVPAVEEKIVKKLDKVLCDICKKDGTEDYSEGNKWTRGTYCVNNTIIEHTVGSDYGADGKNTTTKYFDICDVCFTDKVVPALQSLGANCYTEESDW